MQQRAYSGADLRQGMFNSRRIGIASLLAATMFASACGKETAQTKLPGFPGAPVILISIDTVRADHLPAFGYKGVETPALEAFRRDSILFTNAYSHVPLTLPSHVSVLSGLLPPDNGVRNNLAYRFDGTKHPSIPSLLKQNGYATGAAVSAYVLRSSTGLGPLFDFYDDAIASRAGMAIGSLQRPGQETAAIAQSWIDAQGGKPFFFFLHLFEPHSPYEPPERFRVRFKSPYDGEIAAADAIVGEFLDHLRRIGVYDRALIVIMSDHGEGLYDHGEPEHGIFLYREVIHVPLFLKLPGQLRGGSKIENPVGLVDIFPTITTLLGVVAPSGLAGRSLLDPAPPQPDRRLYSETLYPRIHLGWSELRSLVDSRFQFIQAPRAELYAIREDPGEKKNILDSQRRIYSEMKSALGEYGANMVVPTHVDPEEAAKLAALGYLGSTKAAASGPLPDPKDHVGEIEEMKSAVRLLANGRTEEGIAALRATLKKNPGFGDAWNQLAETLTAQGRLDEAEATYKSAIKSSPSGPGEFALPLGRVLLKSGKFDEALAHARLAEKNDPAQAHLLEARIALSRKDLAEAERQARMAMEDEYSRIFARVLLAQIFTQQGKLDDALALTQEVGEDAARKKIGPVESLQFVRGDVLARMGKNSEAKAAFRDEILHFPENRQAYSSLAVVYTIEQRPEMVRPLMEEMVRNIPLRPTLDFAAHTLEELGDSAGAAEWRRRASVFR
ncbi:MAG: sulfatase-like hydrolase/transferase [Acidobacteriota bacterium]